MTTQLAPRFDAADHPDPDTIRIGDTVCVLSPPDGMSSLFEWWGLVVAVRNGGALVHHRPFPKRRVRAQCFGWMGSELRISQRGDWFDRVVAWWIGRGYR